jgi:hypothetical protein
MADIDLSETIAEQAAEPLIHESDGVKTQNRSLDELIKADKYVKSSQASAVGFAGIQTIKINRPGAV